MYVDSVDREEVPWGAVLKLDRAIDADKNTYIRQLRYSRDQRGTLAILSSAGQLQVLQTKKEYMEPVHDIIGSPELLEKLCDLARGGIALELIVSLAVGVRADLGGVLGLVAVLVSDDTGNLCREVS